VELLFHYMYISYHTDLAVLPLDQRVQQANSRTSASSCWCGRRRGGRDPRCWPAASSTTSQCWTQPRGPAGSDAPFLCPGSKVSSCEGTPGPSLGPPAGAHTTAVGDRRLPPVHWGSAGAEHPEGGLLDGFCLNKQAPRPKKKDEFVALKKERRRKEEGGGDERGTRVTIWGGGQRASSAAALPSGERSPSTRRV
jgi:hypothetical protein